MLRSAKSSSSSRNTGGAISGLGLNGSTSSIFRSTSNNNQASGSAESGLHPNLGLHSAAATGNVGLVKFALDNGQPHTSILNGILPLHAACSGGSEPVVRLLIGYGADVNAARIKMTKNSGSGPGTGTEGSTPLHFASANGHFSIVRLLLENGARPTARDRDRQTPLSLASSQGHAACVSFLKSWIDSYGPNGLAKPLINSNSRNNSSSLDQISLRSQRSFESLSSAAAGVKASLRSHKKQALGKVNSNPNLKSIPSSASYYNSPPMLPPPLPTSGRIGATELATNASLTPPQTLSSVPNLLSKENKRRPSLPSIFEKAAHPSPTMPNLHPAKQSESIQELNADTQNVYGKPPVSPSRPSHRLLGKKSFTGLLSKTSSNNIGDLPSVDSKYINHNYGTTAEIMTNLPIPINARARSGSVDVLVQSSPFSHLDRSDYSNMSITSSPTSSTDHYDTSVRQNSTPSHGYRPRKSSNLSITASNPSPLIAQSSVQERNGNLTVEHGRKRSQSTTCIPRQIVPASEVESFRKLSLSQHGTASNRQQSESQSDDTKEFLHSAYSTTKEKINTPTRYRSHRSPLLSSKLLAEEVDSRNPSSSSLGLRQLNSQRSTSSLVSSASSSNTNPKATRGNSFTSAGVEEEEETASRVRLEPGGTTKSHGSPGYSEIATSKTSTSSTKPFGTGLSAQEQAQAILRTAEERVSPLGDVPVISLTQMLAAYGEALAQERKSSNSSYSPDHLRKQTSIASITSNSRNYQLPSVTEVPILPLNDDEMSKSIRRTQSGSLTTISTPPDSPELTRSRAESSATSFSSRSLSSHRQKVKLTTDTTGATLSPPLPVPHSASPKLSTSPRTNNNVRHLDAAWSAEVSYSNQSKVKESSPPSIETLSHRHSPSLPTDLSQFAGVSPLIASSSTETTPRSKHRFQHRPSISDPHSSIDVSNNNRPDPSSPLLMSSIPQTPEFQQTPSLHANDNESRTPLSDFDSSPDLPSANQSQVFDLSGRLEKESSNRLTPSSSQVGTGKRKGTVKAFLHGIKNNVVLR